MKNFSYFSVLALVAPLTALAVGCASAGEKNGDEPSGGSGGSAMTPTAGSGGNSTSGNGSTDGGSNATAGSGGSSSPSAGTAGTGGGSEPNGADAELTSNWHAISAECMGPGRTFGVDDPNPKKDEACTETCNVPCGFSNPAAAPIGPGMFTNVGNKVCACGPAGTFTSPCSCLALPSAQAMLPTAPVGSCEAEGGAPVAYNMADADAPDSFVKQMDGVPCTTEWAACVTPDLPVKGACDFTTPKGCVCLGGQWDCGSTNSWFGCSGTGCPERFQTEGIVDGDIKSSTYCTP